MNQLAALRLAIDFMQGPSRVPFALRDPLPDGVPLLLRIAAGDDEAISAAVATVGRSAEVVGAAAMFFIEQVLFCPDADSYRVLGASSQATAAELRRNLAFLLRWLHPDRDHKGQRSAFAARVTLAWENLKTQERRTAYDQLVQKSEHKGRSRRQKASAHIPSKPVLAKAHRHNGWSKGRPMSTGPSPAVSARERSGFLRRALLFLFARVKY